LVLPKDIQKFEISNIAQMYSLFYSDRGTMMFWRTFCSNY
jgi:hypothetical protein